MSGAGFLELWRELPDSLGIISHIGTEPIQLTWTEAATVISCLQERLHDCGVVNGTTVLLQAACGQSELYSLLLLNALALNGCRVVFPMTPLEKHQQQWCDVLHYEVEISPLRMNIYEPATSIAPSKVRTVSPAALVKNDLVTFIKDSLAGKLRNTSTPRHAGFDSKESLFISTSGSSGEPKFISYDWDAFVASAKSWEAFGLFASDRFGGPGLTLLLAHTMGVRTWINSLYCKQPFCLIDPELFEAKPMLAANLIAEMELTHLTGGPALFGSLLELARFAPSLNEDLSQSLQSVVMTGAPWSNQMAQQIRNAWGVAPRNAFGTTETQQVLVSQGVSAMGGELGAPLPGVKVHLDPVTESDFRLGFTSPFGGIKSYQYHGNVTPLFSPVYSGDLVTREQNGRLLFAHRAHSDFQKDSYGYKIQIDRVRKYLPELAKGHVELEGMLDRPGLVLWAVVSKDDKQNESAKLQQWKEKANTVNRHLAIDLSQRDYQHYKIVRVAVLATDIPRTAKGSFNVIALRQQLDSELHSLRMSHTDSESICDVSAPPAPLEQTDQLNSRVSTLLRALNMNAAITHGERDWVRFSGHSDQQFLDCVGGFGVNLLGHNHPKLAQAAIEFLQSPAVAIADQGTSQPEAEKFCKEFSRQLASETGREYRILLVNGGAEAVDLSLRHAYLAWKERHEISYQKELTRIQKFQPELLDEFVEEWSVILNDPALSVLTLDHAYHGNSISGLRLTDSDEKRRTFKGLAPFAVHRLDSGKADWQSQLSQILQRCLTLLPVLRRSGDGWKLTKMPVSRLIGAIAEPVRGEGGIGVRREDVLSALSEQSFPLILDSIQCGLRRCGSLVGTHVPGDVILFGKAIGGGIARLGAVAIVRGQESPEFEKHSSNTFGNGGLGCKIAQTTLALLDTERVSEKSKSIGERIQAMLATLHDRFPQWVSPPQGKGLMWGVTFRFEQHLDDCFARSLEFGKTGGYLLSAWLFHRHRVRIYPTLSATNTLRIQPSAFFGAEELAVLEQALQGLCNVLQERDWHELCLPIVSEDPWAKDDQATETKYPDIDIAIDSPDRGAERIGFLVHYLHGAEELRYAIPAFRKFSKAALEILFHNLIQLSEARVIPVHAKNLHDSKVWMKTSLVTVDAATLQGKLTASQRSFLATRLQQSVDQLASEGCRFISLGAFNSIVTANGLKLTPPKTCQILTGNTLTVAHAVHCLSKKMAVGKKLCVVGGSGSIGSAIIEELLQHPNCFGHIVIVGSKKTYQGKIAKLIAGDPLKRLEYSTDITHVADVDVVACVANTSTPILFPHTFSTSKQVEILDLSVPPTVSPTTFELPNVHAMVAHPGLQLPRDREVHLGPFLPPGVTYCCAVEAILCGLHPEIVGNGSLSGEISLEMVRQLQTHAVNDGFFSE